MSETNRRIAVIVLLALMYFVSYPDDAQSLTKTIATPLTTVLNLTAAISPWFYGVVAVGIVSVAIVKTWGGRELNRK